MAGQSSEEEMYNNESAGPALEEFLTLLGERVRLKGFTKYRAQLDIKSTCTFSLTLNIKCYPQVPAKYESHSKNCYRDSDIALPPLHKHLLLSVFVFLLCIAEKSLLACTLYFHESPPPPPPPL